ncbi:MAG TPA: hypothetical protein VIG33_16905 [Pseudobdellovibrionaceae bacterium]
MFQSTLKKFNSTLAGVTSAILFVSFISSQSFALPLSKTLGFFNGALQAKVSGPKSLTSGSNKDNTFTVQITDANGAPYPAITKEWVKATIEMTSMDMGVDSVRKISDILDAKKQLQGKLAINPEFSMKGPWKLNLSITVSDANGQPMTDTQSLTFNVN